MTPTPAREAAERMQTILNGIVDTHPEYGWASVKDGNGRYLLDCGNAQDNERLKTFVGKLHIAIEQAITQALSASRPGADCDRCVCDDCRKARRTRVHEAAQSHPTPEQQR